ncbi:DNA-processing protein DprA [Verrucomicrobiota bacterium]
MTEREAYIVLNRIEGLGPVTVRRLVETLGSASAILEADAGELKEAPKVGPKLADAIIRQRRDIDVAQELEATETIGARIITLIDDEYPQALSAIYDPPLALYIWGELLPEDGKSLAIVGSRSATNYGIGAADRFGFQLAQLGFTVVSGMARGIDTAAHRGALKAKGRTIAVLGGALDCLYPPENAALAEQIAASGAVISEYPLGRQADRQTFPYRNRIISGMTMGALVVECGRKSGTLHTADAALEQGKTVFAIPGRIDSPSSKGANHLIKNGACLVDSVDDILHEFDLFEPYGQQELSLTAARPDVPMSGEEQQLVEALWQGSLDVDSLSRVSGLPIQRVSSLLIGLELKRVVRMLPGRYAELRDDLINLKME